MHAIMAGALAALLLHGAPSDGFEAVVSRVVDGDTLIVLSEDGRRAPYRWVGSLRTGRFGPPESLGRYLPEERILFESEERALAAGYAREE